MTRERSGRGRARAGIEDRGRLVAAAGFSFRSPLLPFCELEALAAGDLAAARAAVAALLGHAEVRDALLVASPSLSATIEAYLAEPDSPRGRQTERALVRYLARMAARPTPFGLFAGVSAGAIGERTRLETAGRDRYRRHTRLDNDYLFALAAALAADPEIRAELIHRPSSSLYAAGDRLRYAEARLRGKERSHHLVAVEPTDYLERTLARAEGGARPAELAAALEADEPDLEPGEAAAFIDELIEAQLLVPDLAPAVTGPEPVHGMLEVLGAGPAGAAAAATLARARRGLEAIDAGGLGAAGDAYREVAEILAGLPAKVELSRLFQVNMAKPSPAASLSAEVLNEIERAVSILARCAGGGDNPLSRFRDAFRDRYGDREVPLALALDEEAGIGFSPGQAPESDASPLLEGLPFRARAAGAGAVPWSARDDHLCRLLHRALSTGARSIELVPGDLDRLAADRPAPLPEALSVMATVAAGSIEDVDAGRFQVVVSGASGPSGANLLGRFCHLSPEILALVRGHLEAEEAGRPEALFAEVVHLPEGRIGNVLLRPVLRDYEIPFLGKSGAPGDRQIPITDLVVAIAGDRVVLRSRRLGREVIPRLTSAHNFSRGLGLYRFLCMLQGQDGNSVSWSWGPLEAFPFLPRVSAGRAVLCRARWRIEKDDLAPLVRAARDDDRDRLGAAAGELRDRLGLPRWVWLADGDNQLPLDFASPLLIESVAHLVKNRAGAVLREMLPGPGELVASGPEGAFVHEIVVPFTQSIQPTTVVAPAPRRPGKRAFPPGSEWLYLKIYAGNATADDVLATAVRAIAGEALAAGLAERWFFLRYADPDFHLRLRFFGEPATLAGELLPRVHRELAPLLARGVVWKLELATYEREVERYGGHAGIEVAEELFAVDSEAALEIVRLCAGDEGADARWRLALRAIDDLLSDLGLALADKHRIMTRMRDGFGLELGIDTDFQRQLGKRFRPLRGELATLLSPAADADLDHPLAPGLAVLAERRRRQAPIAARLRRLEAAGELSVPLEELARSYVHMHVNRVVRGNARAHELVLYDFLRRHYDSLRAREDRGER